MFCVLTSQKTTKDQQRFLSLVGRDNKIKSRIENNILITGIKENKMNPDADNEIVEKVLSALEIDSSNVKNKKRIKRKNPNDGKGVPLKPFELIIVEFKKNSTQSKALLNSKNLKENDELKHIYINRDKTEVERLFDRDQRLERNRRNDLLTHQVVGNPRLRYSIRQDKSIFYWRIRNLELYKIPFSLPADATGEPRANKQ